jgi:hypothetical protein
MAKYIEEFTGVVRDTKDDHDEWMVCTLPSASRPHVCRSIHTDFRLAKLAQMTLMFRGIDAWIEHLPAVSLPPIEAQLDAELREGEYS